ncbi:MAG TPA: TolC family protein [Gemmataceae bacterium]|nr:TolC family protein [Gemmataceae bacterium]
MKRLLAIGVVGCLTAGLLSSAAGCAVHHYHHFVEGGGDPVIAAGPIPGILVPVPGPTRPQNQPTRLESVSSPRPTNPHGLDPVAYRSPGKDDEPKLLAPQKDKAKDASQPLAAPRRLMPDGPSATAEPAGLTLDQVINTTLIADPKIRAGLEAINQANADALTASLKPNPELFTDVQLLPLTRPFTVDAQGGPPQQDVIVSYPIDWFLFGKRAAAMQAATLGVRVSEAEYADLVRRRVLEAATAYYDVLEAKALLELARQDVENLKQVEAITQKAVDAGNRPQVELNRIRLDRLRSEQILRDTQKTLVAATATLRSLLGRADDDPAFDLAGTLDTEIPGELLSADAAFSVALDNRPDLNALRWKVQQAQAGVESERRKAFPTLTPAVGYTRQYQTKAIGFPDANSYSLSLTTTLPFHDRNQGNRVKAASVAVQNNYELQAGVVALRAEVVQADQELRTAAANTRAVGGEQLKVAEQVRDTINQSYALGNRPLIDALDAQRNYRETYRLFINSRANYGRASTKYNATLGKRVAP